MSEIDKIIDKLPDEIQNMVRVHINTILIMEADRLQQWLLQIASRHWNGAYQTLNERLTPSERLIEQDRLNTLI